MSEDTMTNPVRESSGSVEEAAGAIGSLLNPQEPEQGQPEEDREESNAEDQPEVEEPETEESEVETEDQPEGEGEEADESESSEDRFLIGDEEVTADQIVEWKKNGMMEADYRQKTQALAEEKRAFEAEKEQELTSLRSEYESKLAQFADVVIDELKQFEGKDWEALKRDDPYAYGIEWADYQRAQARAKQASEAIQSESAKVREEAEAARQQRLAQAAEEVKKIIPDLADPAKAPVLMSEMTSYLKGVGMADEAIASIEDPAAYKVIYDAMQFSKINSTVKTAGKKKVSPVTKVVKPGSTATKATVVERETKARQQKMNRLKETGSYKDAAALFRDML